ncbi:MAG TPA: amidohydrolase family protein [Longimicrobiales bacterium]
MRQSLISFALAPLALLLAHQSVLAQQSAPVGSFTAGPIALVIDSARTWQVSLNGVLAVEGEYAIRGDTLVLNDRGGPRACAPTDTGIYTWTRAERTLTLAMVADPCQGRAGALAREWSQAPSGLQALSGLHVIDGTGAAARAGMTIVIQDGRIADVYPDGTRPLPAGAERVDLTGRWAIPGLIDVHVHVATDPSGTDARAAVLSRLLRALHGGVTTIRDMGGDARMLAGLARDAELGEIESPAILYSAIFAGPAFFRDRRVLDSSRGAVAGQAAWARAIRPDTDLRVAIAEAKGAGARAVKLYADLPAELIGPIVAEAHRQGMLVWSHAALFPARPSGIVAAGVDVVSHAPLLAWEAADRLPDYGQRANADFAGTAPAAVDPVLREMAARGTILDPTLFVYSLTDRQEQAAWAAAVTSRARELGVRIATGTDGLIGSEQGKLPNVHRELELLVERAGLTPLQAIAAATSIAAAAVGVQDDRGTIAPGMTADLVILESDPVADIRNTRSIRWVMRNGRRYPPDS